MINAFKKSVDSDFKKTSLLKITHLPTLATGKVNEQLISLTRDMLGYHVVIQNKAFGISGSDVFTKETIYSNSLTADSINSAMQDAISKLLITHNKFRQRTQKA